MSPEIASDTDVQTVSDRLILARRHSGGSQSEKLQRKKFIRSSIPSSSDDGSVSIADLSQLTHNFIVNRQNSSQKLNFRSEKLSFRKGSSGYANSTNSEKVSEKSCELSIKISEKSCSLSDKSCPENINEKFCQEYKSCQNSPKVCSSKTCVSRRQVNSGGRVRRSSASASSHFSNTYNRLSDDSCDCCSLGQKTFDKKCCQNATVKFEDVNPQDSDQLKAQLEVLRAEKMAWMQEREELLARLRRINISNFDSDDVEMV